MKKYFVISDIHSFFSPMIKSLNEAGYQKDNREHILIILGDLFDRGDETVKLYEYLKTIPKDRLVLIKGNHELLYEELLMKTFPDNYDFSNKTVKTFCDIANSVLIKKGIIENRFDDHELYRSFYSYYIAVSPLDTWKEILRLVKGSNITKFILNKASWLKYYELGKYIFVHSFIPTKLKEDIKTKYGDKFQSEDPIYYEFDNDWRKIENWDSALWGCPFRQYKAGLFKPEENKGKVLVCGHWHTSDFFKFLDANFSYEHKCGPIYLSPHLIAIDGGVIWSKETGYVHQQNVLVIEEDKIGV